MSDYPYSGGKGPFGGNPLDNEANAGPKCPKCKKADFDAYSNQYGIFRKCRACKQTWSGGSFSSVRPDFRDPLPVPGTPAPEDLPLTQYTGAAFRDPSKNSE
jgi:hypothetical protein